MEMKGTIADVGLPVILRTVHLGKMTGTLTLESDREKGEIFFRNGTVIFAQSTRNKMKIGEILVNQNKIHESDIENILTLQKNNRKKFGELLLASGKISEEEIAKSLGYQAEEVIFDILSWKEGTYRFDARNFPEDLRILVSEETSNLISEGRDQFDELLRIRETIPSMNVILELNPLPEKKEKDRDVDLTLDEWQILSFVDGNRSVAQICALSPANTFITCRIINNLINFDIVIPQTIRLFDEDIDDASIHLQKITTILTIYGEVITSISKHLAAETGNNSQHIFMESLREVKENFANLFSDLTPAEDGTLNVIHLMQNVLNLQIEQQIPSLRNGLNSLIVSIIIKLKDSVGKKKYHSIIRFVFDDLQRLFEMEELKRKEIKSNLETVIKHTNLIPSSFKLGLTYFNNNDYEQAFAEFSKIPDSNPNYKKATRYLNKIKLEEPAIEEQFKEDEPPETPPLILEESDGALAITEPEMPKKVSNKTKIVQDLLGGLKKYSLGKYQEAVALLDKVLLLEPLNSKASKYRNMALEKMATIIEEKIGDLTRKPILNTAVTEKELESLTLSPHEGYLLSRIDGKNSLKDIIAVSGLDKYSALKIFNFFFEKELILFNQEMQADVKPDEPEEDKVSLKTAPLPVTVEKPKQSQSGRIQKPQKGIILDRESLAEQHYRTGINALKEGDFTTSVEELEAAILNSPNNTVYYNALAEAREKKRSIESGDHYSEGLQQIKRKNYAKAVRLLKKAVANSPRNFQYFLTLADVLTYVPGKKEEAILYYRKALDLEPNNTDIMVKIGDLYRLLGKKEMAIKAFRNCLALDSKNTKALRELRRLQML